MPEPDRFDPTHALDGWRPPAPAPLDLDALLPPRPSAAGRLLLEAAAAGFDPTHALDGWRPPAPAPLDLELKSMLRTGALPDEAKLARLKARGYEMRDVEDVELLEAPPAPLEEAVDLSLPDEAVWPRFEAEAQVLEDDLGTPAPARPQRDPRLLAGWQAGAWAGMARQLAAASTELLQTAVGLRVQTHAPQWLCALWPPQAEGAPLGRWPEMAGLLSAGSMAEALQQLLGELPGEAPLWPAEAEADWELVAELVLHQDAGLLAPQRQALQELAAAERLARFGQGYEFKGRMARRRA